MKLIIEKDERAMSESCMQIVLGEMMQDKRVNISLTSGRSPRTMYKMMIPYVKDQKKFDKIEYYIFDDGPRLGETHGPVWDEMHELFYTPANIPDSRVHCITRENWMTYDEEIRNAGGLDLMVIGLGFDGHFCSNSPHVTPMDSYSYEMERKKIIEKNPVYRERPEIPMIYTMGPKSLMRVRRLVMIVNGKEKAEILKAVLDSPVSDALPSTVLKLHPNFTIIADEEAASLLNPADYENC
ncbi:MAG: 6-phosphogluconolactonase [Bulleidia sp.]|nr:6-phosphogluconolactonase [Erysipelotrichaceae bacterium]MDD6664148.1 6-phosphogluconolactonase [Bulleidia sp.]MDY4808474.1 6-phosphogluconolactonase [Bulleidia sp.]HAW12350.1 hypothetical protein [Erysipelotrichaceae bacterium]